VLRIRPGDLNRMAVARADGHSPCTPLEGTNSSLHGVPQTWDYEGISVAGGLPDSGPADGLQCCACGPPSVRQNHDASADGVGVNCETVGRPLLSSGPSCPRFRQLIRNRAAALTRKTKSPRCGPARRRRGVPPPRVHLHPKKPNSALRKVARVRLTSGFLKVTPTSPASAQPAGSTPWC